MESNGVCGVAWKGFEKFGWLGGEASNHGTRVQLSTTLEILTQIHETPPFHDHITTTLPTGLQHHAQHTQHFLANQWQQHLQHLHTEPRFTARSTKQLQHFLAIMRIFCPKIYIEVRQDRQQMSFACFKCECPESCLCHEEWMRDEI